MLSNLYVAWLVHGALSHSPVLFRFKLSAGNRWQIKSRQKLSLLKLSSMFYFLRMKIEQNVKMQNMYQVPSLFVGIQADKKTVNMT